MTCHVLKFLGGFIISNILISMSASQKSLAQDRVTTLEESFSLALQRSAVVGLRTDQIDQTEAQIKQAQSGYLPKVSVQAMLIQQDEGPSSTEQSTTNINLSQNLFKGFRDTATVSQRKNLKLGFEWSKKQSIQQLYKDVAQAFYSILIFQSDMARYREQIETTTKRKSELNSAKRSGRARDSDILTAESSIANLEAAVSRIEGVVVTYQEAFAYLTGLSKEVKLVESIRLTKDADQFGSVDRWLKKADSRPDIQQAKSDLLASEDGIRSARSGFYPTLGLSANYYLSRPIGLLQNVDWDTSLTLSLPLFSGGLTRAQVSEASLIKHSKALMLRQTQESADQIIRATYATLKADFNQWEKLDRASDLSRRSYLLLHRDNRLGVATNADVLTSLQIWQESKRNLERIRITTLLDYIKLVIETNPDPEHVSSRDK